MMRLQVCYPRHGRITKLSCQRFLLEPHAILSSVHLNIYLAQTKHEFQDRIPHGAFPNMTTPVQQNLIAKNKGYASTFKQGNLALPPAKNYAVGASLLIFI
jgi:hypothetical protein